MVRLDALPGAGEELSAPLGLTEEEAQVRLAIEGRNELPAPRSQAIFHVILEVLREPMLLLLAGIAILYAILGDRIEAATIGFSVLVVLAMTLWQERRTERALESLRRLTVPQARVLRGGVVRSIDRAEIVPGDLVLVSEGDRIPADGLLLNGVGLSVDESSLTGESVPVRKRPGSTGTEMARPGGDDTPFLYSGTLVVRGHGTAVVKATAARTEIGRIGASLQDLTVESSPLQRESRRLVRVMGVVGAALCVVTSVAHGLRHGEWLDGILVGLTMAISVVPEEIPVVLTILMAVGAWRIARSNVLTRRLPALESLGAATALCVDKTGTLTQNSMAVVKALAEGKEFDVARDGQEPTPGLKKLIRFAVLASQPTPTDPMEKALVRIAPPILSDESPLPDSSGLMAEYGLTPDLLAVSYVWSRPDGEAPVVATKGAPEAVARLCRLDAREAEEVRDSARRLAAQGLRVIAVAAGELDGEKPPTEQSDLRPRFLGLVALADPIRPQVPAAVRECAGAGLRVIMLTGDLPATASSIAGQIGLASPERVTTGEDLRSMSDADLAERVRTCNVYARIMPEEKLRLVRALKAQGEVVAMTGDGVNDAPALRAADIGIAMGARGTDVAREASDLILMDDDFSSIVRAIRLGRRTFDNLRHALSYIVAIHIPIAGLTVIPALIGWPLVLLPIHIVLLEMTIDPACATVFEAQAEAGNLMSRPPRRNGSALIGGVDLRKSLLDGTSLLAVTLAVFATIYTSSHDPSRSRTLAFVTFIVGNLVTIAMSTAGSRSVVEVLRRPSRPLMAILAGSSVVLSLLLAVPALRERAHFATVAFPDLALAALLGILSVGWLEIPKAFARRRSTLSPGGRISPLSG